MTGNLPTRSPWLEQLRADLPPTPLDGDAITDVVIVGGGIAGAATAYFLLRDTDRRVLLMERGRTGHGATGHNAGQLATYFERPLRDLVDEYGFDLAMAAQRGLDGTWGLMEELLADLDGDIRVDRFTGNMGMFSLDHVTVHLDHSALRRDGGLHVPECLVSQDAPFVADIPRQFDGLYTVVPDRRVREVLGPGSHRYCAVLRSPIGAANGALLVQHIVDHLQKAHPERFRYHDTTLVERVVLHADRVRLHANGHTVQAARVVMCTNGFVDHVVENLAGAPIDPTLHHRLIGTKGYMAGTLDPAERAPHAYSFIRNQRIGDGETPYVYVTRRPWEEGSLMVVGGPEETLDDAATYDADAHFPAAVLDEFDREVMPLADPHREPGAPYDFHWHGLMGYTTNRLRMIGPEPRNPVLMYNLGCNGVGFMPSVFGGHRIARMVAGDDLGPSIFDPPG